MSISRLKAAIVALLITVISGCGSSPEDAADSKAVTAPNTTQGGCPAEVDVIIEGRLFGAIAGPLVADPESTLCEGMQRPTETGVRLRFNVRNAENTGAITAIMGIDGVSRHDAGQALRTTLTLINETSGTFFSSTRQEICFTDIERHDYVASDNVSLLSGVVWCTAGIPEIGGKRSVRIDEIHFSGVVQWRADTLGESV